MPNTPSEGVAPYEFIPAGRLCGAPRKRGSHRQPDARPLCSHIGTWNACFGNPSGRGEDGRSRRDRRGPAGGGIWLSGRCGDPTIPATVGILRHGRMAMARLKRSIWFAPLLVIGCSGPSFGMVGIGIGLGFFGLILVIVVGLALFMYREIAAVRERIARAEMRQKDPED